MAFRNVHLSYARLSRYEQCPLSFKFHYIDKKPALPGNERRFGKVVHATNERLVREAIDDERVGPLDETRAFDLFQHEWAAEGLTGAPLFSDGIDMVRSFVRDQGVLD